MAKTKRLSNSSHGSVHMYCKPDKELLQSLLTKHMIGIKTVEVTLPTFYNITKKKNTIMYIGNNVRIIAVCHDPILNGKQGKLIKWTFSIRSF